MNEKDYNKIVDQAKQIMLERQSKYGNSIDVIDLHTTVGLMIMKLSRIYKLGDDAKTLDELQDVLNYSVFAIEKVNKK